MDAFLDGRDELVEIQPVDPEVLSSKSWFVGIDGDGTGRDFASYMRNDLESVEELAARSGVVTSAMSIIKSKVRKQCGDQSILFCTGDDILFRASEGQISRQFLSHLLDEYRKRTGLTASAGVGGTPYQASIALRLAKSEGGGGIKIVSLPHDPPAA